MKGLSVQQTCEVISRYNVADDLECVSNLLSLDSVERATVLRDHNKRSVSDKNEIEYRRALDGVLELISALEVISIASNAMPELPPELGREFLAILEDTYIKKYYEAFYPMALPILCRAHLNLPGKSTANFSKINTLGTMGSSDDVAPVLLSFLELDARRKRNDALSFFLDLLDGYVFRGVSLDTILDIVEDPDMYESRVLKGIKEPKYRFERRGVKGLEDFLGFCVDLQRLLSRLGTQPLLRGAIWSHYCYWLGNGGRGIRYAADELRMRLKNWSRRSSSVEVSEIINRETRTVTKTLIDLTDWNKYAAPLIEATAPLLDKWASIQRKS